MTTDEWISVGEIFYNESHDVPRLKFVMRNHIYEIQASKFDPIMQTFSVLVDGTFHASKYESLDRLLKLDEISKSRMCSEKEQLLIKQIESLKEQIDILTKENIRLDQKYKDAAIIIFDGV
jgi:hypothetical protein